MTTPYEGFSSDPVDESEPTDTEELTDAETDNDEEHDEESSGKKAARRKATARGARLTATQVRRVLAQSGLIDNQDDAVRSLLAAALGTSQSTEDLVVATLSATKAPAEAINEIVELAGEEDPFQAVVSATAIVADRDSARRVWGLLTSLGKVSGAMPAKDVQAGAKIAGAARALTVDDLVGLSAVTDLLGG